MLEVDGRMRDVCSTCGAVLYRNPLPVAASVVLNDKRQVLLVRRRNEDGKRLWCQPTGFAELNETIMHAALRELEEEAGITGRVVRLLSADSTRVPPYGDLLIITFEIEKTGGEEAPGDDADAEDVAYFGTDHPPRLAFSSNQGAIDACMHAHREEWAIGEDFFQMPERERLQNRCSPMRSSN
ncbi:MAG: NUDIX domain-containing protein [Desulfobacterales bacterium]|nr:NUDIX domain-containing protein [Desulfobacterales bacterium]